MAGRKTQLNFKRTSTYDLDLFVFQAIGIIFLFLTGFNQGAQLNPEKPSKRAGELKRELLSHRPMTWAQNQPTLGIKANFGFHNSVLC